MELGPNTLVACTVICIDVLPAYTGREGPILNLSQSNRCGSCLGADGDEAGFLQETDPPQTGSKDTLAQYALWLPYQVS